MSEIILDAKNVKKYFPIKGGLFRNVVGQLKAVDDVTLKIHKGETFGLVGESGCGKSTLGRTIMQLYKATAGEITLNGANLLTLSKRELQLHRRDFQMIFQDPFASLNPRFSVFQTIKEPLDIFNVGSPQDRRARIEELLEVVGLRRNVLNRYPHEFSGGQRQRIGIARALASKPKFIVADEPVSALDVSVQSQILNLISDLQKEMGISFLFIAHDLAVVQHIGHRIGVMYLGKIVETASSESLYTNPLHPYTKSLLSAIPDPDPHTQKKQIILKGDVPSPINPPPGCPFSTRCPEVKEICFKEFPATSKSDKDPHHFVSCHLY